MLQAVTSPPRSPEASAGAAILARARGAFERRLDPSSRAPVAVGFSGGGDSLALLLGARAWTSEAGRPLLVLTVDHGLGPQSRAWTEAAETLADRLGADFRGLSWTGEKPRAAAGRPARGFSPVQLSPRKSAPSWSAKVSAASVHARLCGPRP